ncbi:rhomboid family intramembrane serine protease [Bacillus sp. T33-2]|nr:rhomboid family intramembrane serine protease [Bacillus sp. T33-2]
MVAIEDYLFWRLANYLITGRGYRIIQLSQEQHELWLEKTENKVAQVIRLLRYDLDWGNWLQRDIELAANNGEQLRKQLFAGELTLLNIYFTPYPPVDNYEFRIEDPYVSPDTGKVTVSTLIVDRTNYLAGFDHISSIFDEQIALEIKDEYGEQELFDLKQNTLQAAVKKAKAEKSIFEYGKPFFTYILIGIQIVVFLLMELRGSSTDTATLITFGAKFNPSILQGEWWRFFTPIVLHIGVFHLLMNTLALYYLGAAVERIYGNFRFLFIYLVAGFSGSVASFIFSPNLSAGASGAIFGCFGALLYFGVIYPRLFFRTMGLNILVVLGINLAFGFTIPGIDNAGHIGGLIGGFAATGIVHFPKKRRLLLQLFFLAASAAGITGALQYGYGNPSKIVDEQSILTLAGKHIREQEYSEAYVILKDFSETDDVTAETLFQLSFVEIKLGKLEDAKKHLHRAIDMKPEFHEAHFNLALIYLDQNNATEAKTYAENAVEIEPDRTEYKDILDKINAYLQSASE